MRLALIISSMITLGLLTTVSTASVQAAVSGGERGTVTRKTQQNTPLILSNITNPIQNTFPLETTNLAGVISSVLRITLMIVAFLMFVWLAWGVFQYLFAGGNKEALKKAQGRITWAIVGFVITILAFSIAGFVQDIARNDSNQIIIQEDNPANRPK